MLYIIEQDIEEIRIPFHVGKPQLLIGYMNMLYFNRPLLPLIFFLVKCNALKFQRGLVQTELC